MKGEALQVREYRLVPVGRAVACEDPLREPGAVAEFIRQRIGSESRENFVAVYLDRRLQPIGWELIARGSVSCTVVHPREVFRGAILRGASGVVVGHNHPSGLLDPSGDDCEITERLQECGKLVGIDLVDHVVVGPGGYWSFLERGML